MRKGAGGGKGRGDKAKALGCVLKDEAVIKERKGKKEENSIVSIKTQTARTLPVRTIKLGDHLKQKRI